MKKMKLLLGEKAMCIGASIILVSAFIELVLGIHFGLNNSYIIIGVGLFIFFFGFMNACIKRLENLE